jgi:ABC-type branched-subunit amino acid transport system substrate-binding protein/predicted Ser/Thr protein kinase
VSIPEVSDSGYKAPTVEQQGADSPTVAPPAQPPAVRPAAYSFLAPPQGPGEIGWLAHYRVVRLLGAGGMGMVFEALDIHLQRQVALKVMKPDMTRDSGFRQRFLREARATAAVKSDHIVTIHQVGLENDVPFLAMEFLHGQTLEALLDRHGPPKLPEALRLAAEIAEGLAAAHECGLVHRDIKPANIWIEQPSGRIKILDFGLARPSQEGTRLTEAGIVMGTPAYMAPEQTEGADVDARADLFSLGCVLYELIGGKKAFTGSSTMAILKAVAMKDPPPLRQLNEDVPAELEDLVMRLLAKKPEDRPASGREVADLLRDLHAGSGPTLAVKGSAVRQRHHRPAPGMTARRQFLLVAGGAAVVAGGWFFFNRLRTPSGSAPRPTFQGVSETEIFLGISAPFSGPARELGRGMELGISIGFQHVNDQGGVAGRKLTLVPLDDGYDPDRALANMKELDRDRKVFGFIGNVGTPTAEKALPYALERAMLFFGAFTGAKLLRKDPPDRYVFNYRASYEEETAAMVQYLVERRKIKPAEIAVFAQQDGYGDSGYRGVVKAMRKYGQEEDRILRVGYARNTTDVAAAAGEVLKHPELRAIVMVPTYRPAARFIQQVKTGKKDMIFSNVSFVGSDALAEELMQLCPEHAAGVIVTQVVPHPDAKATGVLKYRELFRKYYPNERPSFISLEGYIIAIILAEGLGRAGDVLTTETLVDALESIRGLDLGIGTSISFGPSDHQASHKVWGAVLDEKGKYQILDLED